MNKIDYATYKKPSDFIRFNAGTTKLVIISNGYLQKKHGMKTATGYIPLPDCTETPDCPQCLKGNEPKQKWVWIVFIPAEKKVGILDAGAMIGDAICKQAQSGEYDPLMREVTIVKEGTGLRTKYETTVGNIITLSPKDEAFIEPSKRFLVTKYFKK
jgi:hypothetical protein